MKASCRGSYFVYFAADYNSYQDNKQLQQFTSDWSVNSQPSSLQEGPEIISDWPVNSQ